MADNLSEVFLAILLDKAAQRDLQSGLSAVEKELGKLDDIQLRKLSLELESVEEVTSELQQRFATARQEAEKFNTVSEKLSRNSTMLFAAGAAVVGGLALSAQNYVKFVEGAGITGDETAERWIAASKRVKNAQLNLGQASAQALLPILEKAAELAEKTASFINQNPEVVQAALNTGLVVATLGAVGIAVSKGIRLYADFKYLAATAEFELGTRRFENSVKEYLAGTFLPGLNKGKAAAEGSGAGLVGTIAISAIAIAAGVAISKAIVDAVSAGLANTDFGRKIDEAQKRAAEGGRAYPGINIYARKGLEEVDKAAQDAGASTEKLANGLRDFQGEADLAAATKAFISYRQQEAQAEKQYGEQRSSIVKQGLAQINNIEANYQSQRANLIKQNERATASALANFNFQQGQAAAQFAQQEAQASKQYQQSRKETQEAARQEELKATQDHQRELRKLQEEHEDKVLDLVASRDALGLVRENRDFNRKQREAEEEFRVESQRRRQETRQKIRDLDEQYQQERAKAREEFNFRQQQAAEQFKFQQAQAKAQFDQRLKDLDEQHSAELAKARQQQAEKLRELELQFRQEQVARRNAFYDILRDLNANLLNEENIRNQYYARMQQDLVKFLSNTAASVGGAGSNLPGYQSGGYTPEGAIRAHRGEFVADRQSTRALENLIGGRLTQQNLQAFASGGGQTVINATFPGGMISMKTIAEELDRRDSQLIRKLVRGIA